MEQDWKPGDVAMVDPRSGSGERLAVYDDRVSNFGKCWRFPDTGTWTGADAPARPLVVIDPEDREQVAVIMGHFSRECGDIFGADGVTFMQAALREFANPTPPKPDEPLGLGAVVEDAEGEIWIRTSTPEGDEDDLNKPWYRQGLRKNWLIVDAATILNEGVTL